MDKRKSEGEDRCPNFNVPPVIVLTAKDQMEVTFRMEGVAEYFVKPLDTEEFLKKVKKIIPEEHV